MSEVKPAESLISGFFGEQNPVFDHLWLMEINCFVFNPFFENTYVLSDESHNALIVDPGCYEEFEVKELVDYTESNGLKVVAILNTHCHIDHVLGNDAIKDHYKVPLLIPVNEKQTYQAIPSYASNYGFSGYREAEADEWYTEGERILGELKFSCIEVPGHSPGHMVFYFENEKVLIGGDVLFRESIGRTDLPGGNHTQLLQNIKERIYTLPEDVTVFPGHGPETSIGHEKVHNPFVKG